MGDLPSARMGRPSRTPGPQQAVARRFAVVDCVSREIMLRALAVLFWLALAFTLAMALVLGRRPRCWWRVTRPGRWMHLRR